MRKKIIVFFLLCVISFILPAAVTSAAGTDMILNDKNGIPDKVLYQEILRYLKSENIIEQSKNEFTKQEAEKLEALYLDGEKKQVKNFKGIGYLKNLKYLSIKCGIKKVKGMESLPKLKSLDLADNQLKDIKFLKKFKNLKNLDIRNNLLKNLEGVGNLKKLVLLEADFNCLTSLKELKGCKNLKKVSVSSNFLKNLKGIENLNKLEELIVYGNQLQNLKGIGRLKKLKILNISVNCLTSLQGIEKLKNLKKLKASGNQLSALGELVSLTEIQEIVVDGNRLTVLPDLREFKKLSSYDFSYNFLSEQEFQTKLPETLLKKESKQVWLKDNINLQNVDDSIDLTEPGTVKQVTKDTTKIAGRVHAKGAYVRMIYGYNSEDGFIGIKDVKADENGYFVFENLNFKKLAGHPVSLQVGLYSETTMKYNEYSYVNSLYFRIKK